METEKGQENNERNVLNIIIKNIILLFYHYRKTKKRIKTLKILKD